MPWREQFCEITLSDFRVRYVYIELKNRNVDFQIREKFFEEQSNTVHKILFLVEIRLGLEPFFLRLVEDPDPGEDPDESKVTDNLHIGRKVDFVGLNVIRDREQAVLSVVVVIVEEVLVDPPDIEHQTRHRDEISKEH